MSCFVNLVDYSGWSWGCFMPDEFCCNLCTFVSMFGLGVYTRCFAFDWWLFWSGLCSWCLFGFCLIGLKFAVICLVFIGVYVVVW